MSEALRNFSGVDLDGREWTADRLKGRVVLLDFWATWCAPCLAEMPRLRALRESHDREDFEILGVSLDASSRRALVSWLNRQRIDWPQIHERRGYGSEVAQSFGVDRLPDTMLIDRRGVMVARGLRGPRLVAEVERLIGEGSAQ